MYHHQPSNIAKIGPQSLLMAPLKKRVCVQVKVGFVPTPNLIVGTQQFPTAQAAKPHSIHRFLSKPTVMYNLGDHLSDSFAIIQHAAIGNGASQNLEVHPETVIVKIMQIEAHLVGENYQVVVGQWVGLLCEQSLFISIF